MTDDSLSITLMNDPSDVRSAVEQVQNFCRASDMPEAMAYRFGLALDEALTNVVSYAFADERLRPIDLKVELRSGELIATISDDGVPFDPLLYPAPDVAAPLDERKAGGLGIHLMRTLTDRIAYRRDGDRNQLTFAVVRDATSQSDE